MDITRGSQKANAEASLASENVDLPGGSSAKGDSSLDRSQSLLPVLSLPKGGGSIAGIGEKFNVNAVNGTCSLTVPISVSPGRSGFGPTLSLSYDSGGANGPFGFGWNLSLPFVTRRTSRGLPRYDDEADSDVFILSGAEDLVHEFKRTGPETWLLDEQGNFVIDEDERDGFKVRFYRPRIEGSFARIERWTSLADRSVHWRSITRDNITSVYGKTGNSRIADPEDESHVFSWLICESYDDKGNAIVYEYYVEDQKRVDLSAAHEANRTSKARTANRYLKRIKYGNRRSRLLDSQLAAPDWMFEIVLDYGDHSLDDPKPTDDREWFCRDDPFSSFRSGFEIRCYRLCRRVLLFHRFAELDEQPVLVRSTDFDYSVSPPANYSILSSVTQSGYRRSGGAYRKKSLPALSFAYSAVPVAESTLVATVETVDDDHLNNLRLSDPAVRVLDLDGEGLPGLVVEEPGAMYYFRNLSPVSSESTSDPKARPKARFAPPEVIDSSPVSGLAGDGRRDFLDLDGDGRVELAQFGGSLSGVFKRRNDRNWEPFRAFASLPVLDWNDPDLIFVDLTGDGRADLLIVGETVFTWHPSSGAEGFGGAELAVQGFDEKRAPALVFTDQRQAVLLADMSGDGLSDVVRVRPGEVCYWPNLGYGRFGARVSMDNAPTLGSPDSFDPQRVRFVDVDGSGTSDLIYLAASDPQIFFNQSGSSWSRGYDLQGFPPSDNVSAIEAFDFLGIGTGCLVWSSALPNDAHKQMRYVDLMGGRKPYLLTKVENNLGVETVISYAPSTRFYLEDQLSGNPWVTKLHFPVHLVERVEIHDQISRNRYITRYAYHHGFYDGVEREFHGFGMVEQLDTVQFATFDKGEARPVDNWDENSHVPPALTKTWFHTGAYFEDGPISKQFANQYFREGDRNGLESGLSEARFSGITLDDTILPAGLTAEEAREACRSLKGNILRLEVYAVDGTAEANRPYLTSERNYTVRLEQPRESNRHGVFFTHQREAIDSSYERKLYDVGEKKLADPRVAHQVTLAVDEYGNELETVSIVYGRRLDEPSPLLTAEDRKKQQKTVAVYTENHFTKAVVDSDRYRAPLSSETRKWEIVNMVADADGPANVAPKITPLFGFDELRKKIDATGDGQHELAFEDVFHRGVTTANPYRRLVGHVRTLYRKNDLTGLLPLHDLESMALPGENYRLALTPTMMTKIFERAGQNLLPIDPANLFQQKGGYVRFAGGADWWVPSGRVFFHPESVDAVEETDFAEEHFYLPHRSMDPFSNELSVAYDDHKYLPVESRDPLANKIRAEYDYRVLQTRAVTDQNGNRSEVIFDTLGLVTGTALTGKAGSTGDSLAAFEPDPDPVTVRAFVLDPHAESANLLKSATTRIVYDFDRFQRCGQPSFAATLSRETHSGESEAGQPLVVQLVFTYSDGFGRELQSKIQAAKGRAPVRGANIAVLTGNPAQPSGDVKPGSLILENGRLTESVIERRWIGKGRTVYNNKGQPVKQYEPFFSATHLYEEEPEMTDTGVGSVQFYDPVGRVVLTLRPNNTYEKVIFDPWRREVWDVNDTVTLDPRTDPDTAAAVGKYFESMPTWKSWHAERIAEIRGETAEERQAEKSAAEKTTVHAGTPGLVYLNTLLKPFVTIAHNRFNRREGNTDVAVEERYLTRLEQDFDGKALRVIDARGRRVASFVKEVMQADNTIFATIGYDLAGNLLYERGMDTGERLVLNDIAGQPLLAWDDRGQTFRHEYDELRRPTASFVKGFDAVQPDREVQYEKIVYGDGAANGLTEEQKSAFNLRGKIYRHFDTAGVVTNRGRNPVTGLDEAFDVKGNLLRSARQLLADYKAPPDWSADPPPSLEPLIFSGSTRFDALNRAVQIVAPHDNRPGTKFNVVRPAYNENSQLRRLDVWIELTIEPVSLLPAAAPAELTGIKNIEYDAKGQRSLVEYKNSVVKTFVYERETFRLAKLKTSRGNELLQDLLYTYDPIGNITSVRDSAQQTVFFRNQQIEPHNDFVYDAIYRLIAATGREHLGLLNNQRKPPTEPDGFNLFHINLEHPGDGKAMGRYLEEYVYDEVGNILVMRHRGSDPSHPGWKRCYRYAADSNRLLSTGGPVDHEDMESACAPHYGAGAAHSDVYTYDRHGNMLSMPHLSQIDWNFADRLRMTGQQIVNNGGSGEKTYYVYNSAGDRVRKVTELASGTPKNERIYLGAYEVFRKFTAGVTVLERETLHVMDGGGRAAIVETRTFLAGGQADPAPRQLVRYQFDNHLGSAALELDEQAQIISYEEYYPYGSSSFQAVRNQTDTSKRCRYNGKERDEESGLYYYGTRYYAPWLGRWTSCDPAGLIDGVNLYRYGGNNPVTMVDPSGNMPKSAEAQRQYEEDRKASTKDLRNEGLDIYQKAEDAPKYFDQPYRRSVDTALQQKRRAAQSAAKRAQDAKDQRPMTKEAIEQRHDEDLNAAMKGFWNEFIDTLTPFWDQLITKMSDEAKFNAPKPTGDKLRDYELKESFEGGGIVFQATLTAVSFLPVGEMAEASKLAYEKRPINYNLNSIGSPSTSFSERWAAMGERPAAPGNPQLEPGGNAGPNIKGEIGEGRTVIGAENSNSVPIGKQVTLDVNVGGKTVRIRIDTVAVTQAGELEGVESKFGPFADLTKNQAKVIPPGGGYVTATPRGARALEAGLEPGKEIGIYLRIERYAWQIN